MTKLLAGWPASLARVSAGFTATVCRTSNLLSGQLRGRILRCLQIVALFAVLLVDCEEYLCILVGFLSGARHAIVYILFSLLEAEFLLQNLLQESNYSQSEFYQLSLACRCASPGRSCRIISCGVLSTLCLTMTSCSFHRRTILRVS